MLTRNTRRNSIFNFKNVLVRMGSWLFWGLFSLCYFITPFLGLLKILETLEIDGSHLACRFIWFSRVVALVILCGKLWLEKYFMGLALLGYSLTARKCTNSLTASGHSVSHGAASTEKIAGFELLPFLVDLFVGIGFLGIFFICFNCISKYLLVFCLLQ